MKFLPFRQGDVVKVVAKQVVGVDGSRDGPSKLIYSGKIGEVHIIEMFDLNIEEYSTNKGAWYPHDMFELVEPASIKSYKKLIKSLTDV